MDRPINRSGRPPAAVAVFPLCPGWKATEPFFLSATSTRKNGEDGAAEVLYGGARWVVIRWM